jgi:hypothetical protein
LTDGSSCSDSAEVTDSASVWLSDKDEVSEKCLSERAGEEFEEEEGVLAFSS